MTPNLHQNDVSYVVDFLVHLSSIITVVHILSCYVNFYLFYYVFHDLYTRKVIATSHESGDDVYIIVWDECP